MARPLNQVYLERLLASSLAYSSTLKMEAERFAETSLKTIVVLYSIVSQKVVFIIFTAVITSNLTLNVFILSDIVRILWHLHPFLGNDSERGWYTSAVAK
jgi:hypothetical protein